MKTTSYTYQTETTAAFANCSKGTISERDHRMGMAKHEPLIVIFDAFLAYAKAYKARFGDLLASDYVLGESFIESIRAAHELLNGDGAVAMISGLLSDSKCNSACEEIYQAALAAAGFDNEGDVIPVAPAGWASVEA